MDLPFKVCGTSGRAMTSLQRLLSELSGSGCEHLQVALPFAFCNVQGCAQAGWAATQSRHRCVAAWTCTSVSQCSHKLACAAAALQYKLSMCKWCAHVLACPAGAVPSPVSWGLRPDGETMFISWRVICCRRELLERVQAIWQPAQPSRHGQSRTRTEPVEVIQLILGALKGEEHCL